MDRPLIDLKKSIWGMLEKAIPQIQSSIPSYLKHQLDPDYIIRSIKLELCKNPHLMKCSPESICKAVLEATHYGMCIGIGGEAYLVPFKGDCSFSLSYRGMVKLLLRSGKVSHISAEVVKEGDKFHCVKGMNPDLYHEVNLHEDTRDRPIFCVYAIAFLKDGSKPFVCLPDIEVRRIRNMSQSFRMKGENSIWGQHYEEMAKKTAIRKLFKYMDYSPVVSEILEQEDARESGKEPIIVDIQETIEEKPKTLVSLLDKKSSDSRVTS